MPEKKELIKTIHTKMMCDCGGEMFAKSKHKSYIANGQYGYVHRCNQCEHETFFKKRYPYDKPLEE